MTDVREGQYFVAVERTQVDRGRLIRVTDTLAEAYAVAREHWWPDVCHVWIGVAGYDPPPRDTRLVDAHGTPLDGWPRMPEPEAVRAWISWHAGRDLTPAEALQFIEDSGGSLYEIDHYREQLGLNP